MARAFHQSDSTILCFINANRTWRNKVEIEEYQKLGSSVLKPVVICIEEANWK